MDLTALSGDQLRPTSGSSTRSAPGASQTARADELQQAGQELQAHRLELEMRSRALQEARQEVEFALRRYSELCDHLPIGCVTLSANGEILEANAMVATWLGVDRMRLRGLSFGRFLNPFDAGRFAAHLEACLQTRTDKTFETTMRGELGAIMPVQFTSRVITITRDGQVGVLTTITNVTQLKQTQQVLTEIKREQDALGDSISHDLRSPLVTIGTYARIVLSEFGETLVPDVKMMVERVERASQRMETTLQQLLTYSILVREDASPEDIATEELVQGVLGEFRTLIGTSQAEVTLVRPMSPVRGCPRLLAPALSNVISNALKFTVPGQPPKVTIAAEDRGQFVVIKVADQGIGIDPQHHERIFQVFDRLHCYSSYPGAGVGLAIVRRAVERMQGRVWVESEKGKGSCFHIMLPRA